MALINVGASRPDPMWAVVRLLTHSKNPVSLSSARALLSPPTLASGDKDATEMFNKAIKTLRELGLLHIHESTGDLALAGAAAVLDGRDWDAFSAALRTAVLAPERNNDLGDNGEQKGSRDLTRALAWFLTLDPMEAPVAWEQAQKLRKDAFKPEVGHAIVNAERWQPFGDWAPALGLAARPLISEGGSSPLTPDCTAAVRYIVQSLWEPGQQINAVSAVRSIREHLPVLPGGEYSRSLHLDNPGDRVAGAALSFALLRGNDEKWLRLELDSDASLVLQVADPEQPSSPRYVSDITMQEVPGA
ncbi:protein DpdG [Streptomyces sp. NPDC056682]|uniref:protein DpdG n=1 Tax=Streptomyces sp. NPDC056682 TaxID=3345909 RepID=UPI00367E8742